MTTGRTWWIALALGVGFGLVAAGPLWLLWHYVGPDTQVLEVRFESVKMDRGALVFAYNVTNRTRWKTRFPEGTTEVNVLQSDDRAPLGYAVVRLPLDVAAHGSQVVEVRLELPRPPSVMLDQSAEGDALQEYLQDTLHDLRGFELVDEDQGIRVVFPRGW
jgi:hypothetical protein